MKSPSSGGKEGTKFSFFLRKITLKVEARDQILDYRLKFPGKKWAEMGQNRRCCVSNSKVRVVFFKLNVRFCTGMHLDNSRRCYLEGFI